MNKNGKFLLLLAGLLLATSCVDDPVSVDEQPIEPVGDVSAQAQYQSMEDGDPFRARLEVDFAVLEKWSPDMTTTVWLEGVATEAITGGQVEVALPTFAAMKLAGPDKPLRYVKGGTAPVVAKWQLPAMEAGDRWKQSLKIGGIAEKGYYQITAHTRAYGPLQSPYVFDETLREAWMFVVEDGGRLTPVFDETIFPEEIIPQPGPFRSKAQYAASASTHSAGNFTVAAAAGAAASISIEFLTQGRGGRNVELEGAKVRADYYERSRLISTVTRTVPDDGIIKLNCPGSAEQYISGTVMNATTSRVNGGHRLARWETRYSQCSGKRQVYGARHLYLPWASLEEAIPKITKIFRYSRRAVTFKVDTELSGGLYDRGADLITFGNEASFTSLIVAGHEYTHALHHKALGGGWHARNCGVSDRQGRERYPTNYRCAMKEGLANFGGHVANDGSGVFWEPRSRLIRPAKGHSAGEYENNVAALFRDLLDSSNEGDDLTSYSGAYVFTVFKTCRTPNDLRDTVFDFVWCLERRVDDDEHRRYFPSENPPSSVREGAAEPGDWDADDIRSTWIQNVGRGS